MLYPPRRQPLRRWPILHYRHVPYTHTARHHVLLLYALTTLWPCTKIAVHGEKLFAGAGLVAGPSPSALGQPLTNDLYHQCRGSQWTTYGSFGFSISVRLVFYRVLVARIALRVILQQSVYCPRYNVPVPRGLRNILLTLLLLLLLLLLCTGCFSCCYPYLNFARASLLLIILLLLLLFLNMLKQV